MLKTLFVCLKLLSLVVQPTAKTPSCIFSCVSQVMWPEKVGQQLRRPTRSVAGWLVSKFFKAKNRYLEENAVQLCGIQPADTVLEVGHGPGLGLQSAAQLLTEPTGRLIGVDYSEYMHKVRCKFSQRGINYWNSMPICFCGMSALCCATYYIRDVKTKEMKPDHFKI